MEEYAKAGPLVEYMTKIVDDAQRTRQIREQYAEGFAAYDAEQGKNQIVQAEDGAGKTEAETELTKDAPGDTLQKKQGGRKFPSEELHVKHYDKHVKEFGEMSVTEYLSRANELADSPLSDDVVELTRSDGSVAKYRFSTNEFVAINADGTIRTFFKPKKGRRYWQDELDRN